MIPLKLQVRNFMCYRDNVAPLDFTGIHLACLAGDNGHGKSALLEAMTWALWGRTRAKRDDELIHLGQTEMEVEFTFALGDNRYRVIRKRDMRGRGRSDLQLQIQAGDRPAEGVSTEPDEVPRPSLWRSITESTIRDTQTRINDLLRMDYDTFINSAFLLQGRADEFTVKPPGERKRILGDILGLGQWDDYEQRAKERAKAKQSQAEQIAARMAEIDRELEREPAYRDELAQAETDAARLGDQLQKAESELRALREEKKELDFKQSQIDELASRVAHGERELADVREQVEATQKRLANYEAALSEREQIEQGFAALVAARARNEELSRKLSQHAELERRRGQLELAITEARTALDWEQRRCADRVAELERQVAQAETWQTDLKEVQEQLARLARLENEQEAKRREVQDIVSRVSGLQTENGQLRAEMEPLKEKVDLLKEAEARCPLCGQGLSDENRQRLVEQFTAEGREKGDRHRANQATIRELTARRETLEGEIAAIDRELQARAALQGQQATLEKSVAEAEAAATELEALQKQLAELEKQLAEKDYAHAEQTEPAELLARLAAVGYDTEAHRQVRADLDTLSVFAESKARLDAALERIGEERANLERLRVSQARWEERLGADRERREALARDVARRDEVARLVAEKSREVNEFQTQERHARDVLAAARQKLDHCRYLRGEREKRLAEQQQAAAEQASYEELRVAFGKKGVQAMIIEHAIPDIEDEANALLSRMTGGRMHVRFETQRETLKGDTVETLDLIISDELGPRPYELYSGGEAFRVNFAIRIALSKLLAHRAGARLQTLIIDEGFGTQDAQGRARLVEAINAIRDDFEKILVITHIDELKDAFPVRIDVWKTPDGSQIAIN